MCVCLCVNYRFVWGTFNRGKSFSKLHMLCVRGESDQMNIGNNGEKRNIVNGYTNNNHCWKWAHKSN